MEEFNIPVTRIGYAHKTLKIQAPSRDKAIEIAREIAGDLEYSEKDADYEFPEHKTEAEQDQEFLIKHIEANPELSKFLFSLLNGLSNGNLRDLITLLKGKKYNDAIDTARPQDWTNKMVNDMQFPPYYTVWNYNEKSFGVPFNIAADVLQQLTEISNRTR